MVIDCFLGAVIPDDNLLRFGSATDGDAHIEYDEDGGDFLTISGSAAGTVLSGSVVLGGAGAEGGHGVTTVKNRLTASHGILASQDSAFNAKTLGNAVADVTTATGQLTASIGLSLPDNKLLRFGNATGGDGHIDYRTGDEQLYLAQTVV